MEFISLFFEFWNHSFFVFIELKSWLKTALYFHKPTLRYDTVNKIDVCDDMVLIIIKLYISREIQWYD